MKVICEKCKKEFEYDNEYYLNEPFQCTECAKSFDRKRSLEIHVNGVHKKLTPFPCQECKKSFTAKGHLNRHISLVHMKIKPFQCQECSKSFGLGGGLRNHIKNVHTDVIVVKQFVS